MTHRLVRDAALRLSHACAERKRLAFIPDDLSRAVAGIAQVYDSAAEAPARKAK